MKRRKLISNGIALTGIGSFSSNSAAQSKEDYHNGDAAGDHDVEFLGLTQKELYFRLNQSRGTKLNIVDRETGKVRVIDQSTGDEVFGYNPNRGELHQSKKYPKRVTIAANAPTVIERVGFEKTYLGSCALGCMRHTWSVLCVELNKFASTVSKAVLVGQVIKAMLKKAPKSISKMLKDDSVADALGAVISAAAGNVVTFGILRWDQKVPFVRDQKMTSQKFGMTSWKPSRNAAALTTYFAYPSHAGC
ncbi:hypothetical protein [Natrinema halophilum]|uniref:Uncharacterized protein n=1 Tax=Natrinema halophilum TaxID=1699371 RepID=A0A7D5GLW7_9EURY|nr:hypothetical protein [Natrinema halophilum]QLG50270.1 hypothetical protein HYG82_16170 [Natrinema halophilum]